MSMLAIAATLLLLAAPAARAAAPKPVVLTTEQKALVSRIETFVNNITTVEAGFVQMSGNGGFARGTLYLQR
ncbi:MAG: outer membrane lipoprotein carrier protein LolA, partial [Alphaproteobacteria bacterium]|nr:outer membrane lipoprotein carrier protein LolA [Alphaproteobacteria bacterium]